MSCVLWIIGEDLDVDDFIKKSKITPNKITRKGEPRFKTKGENEKTTHSSISIVTSNAGFDNLDDQIAETIDFLKLNNKQLQHINKSKDIQIATLDFGVTYNAEKPYQSVRFPAELIAIVGDLNISIEVTSYNSNYFES